MSDYATYIVWKKNMPHGRYGGEWTKTAHQLSARNQQEARRKLLKMFEGCGFHSMRLIALPIGEEPEHESNLANLSADTPH